MVLSSRFYLMPPQATNLTQHENMKNIEHSEKNDYLFVFYGHIHKQ